MKINSRSAKARHFSYLLFAGSLLGTHAAYAQQDTNDTWHYELTPYLWATRMSGDVKTAALPNTHVDMKFGDILENLDMGFMGSFEARKSQWGLLFDGMYMKVSDSAQSTNPENGPFVNANARIKQTMLAGAVAYRAYDAGSTIDVIGGLRYNKIHVDAHIEASGNGMNPAIDRSGTRSWVDPYIGLRATVPVTEKLNAIAYGDIGGFSIGSEFTTQVMLGFNYAHSKSTSMNFGYRYMDIDYEHGGFRYKMVNDGIYTGLTFKF